jgi:microsomal dipeptidase-like Zn-dependent dipeptidase
MEAVELQIRAAKAMEAYIDEISGGPGLGWYRIVYSPAQAREVINAGKLAVVLGVEVDNLFGNQLASHGTPAGLLEQLEYYFSMGIRHVFPIHFSNNAFGGAGYQNPLTYDPNHNLVPTAFSMATQDARAEGYEFQGGRRNTLGLTEFGKLLVRAMMSKGMIIDIDHMSLAAFEDTLAIAEAANYPVVSSHTGLIDISRGKKRHESNLTAGQVERIRRLGGMVALILNQGNKDEIDTWRGARQTVVEHTSGNTSETWAQAYLYACEKMQGGPVGFGTDFNGVICPTGPRFGPDAGVGGKDWNIGPTNRVIYPFTALASGQQLERSLVGNRTFDINDDGIAHIGLLPDFIADLETIGVTEADLDPLLSSAEGYILMWEKAERSQLPPIENARCRVVRGAIQQRQAVIARKQEEKGAARLPNGKPDLAEIAVIQAEIDELRAEIRQLDQEKQSLGCL